MQAISTSFRTAAMSLALTVAVAAQTGTTANTGAASSQDTAHQQAQGNQVGQANSGASGTAAAPTSNPGFGQQVPNDSTLSGGQPHSNSTYQKDRNGNQGLDLGWLGLLGLAGLFGLGRGRSTNTTVSHEMQNSGSNRS
jgi:hypothetical protein